tara:strand:+ start:286 stop:411 length:126 start_codon:yes stop_codon:yes gene_type:complete
MGDGGYDNSKRKINIKNKYKFGSITFHDKVISDIGYRIYEK